MRYIAISTLLVCNVVAALPAWDFNTEGDLAGWLPNGQFQEVHVSEGALKATATDWDPFFTAKKIEIPTSPWQYVLLRIKASQAGRGELFWSKDTEGQYGGFSQSKVTAFHVTQNADFQEIAIVPFWGKEGTIRQLRLDLYDATDFEIDSIRILAWDEGKAPQQLPEQWDFTGEHAVNWARLPGDTALYSPPLEGAAAAYSFIGVALRAQEDSVGEIIWANDQQHGPQSQSFEIRGDEKLRWYNLEVQGLKAWKGELQTFGIRLPQEAGCRLETIKLANEAVGPPELYLAYAGFENGVNRAGRDASLLIQLKNRGGDMKESGRCTLKCGPGLNLQGSESLPFQSPEHGSHESVYFSVLAASAGDYQAAIEVQLDGQENGPLLKENLSLHFLPERAIQAAEYVPKPQPVASSIDVCMYYFPGWYADSRWDCVRTTAPIRKPLLGYYDEANPECVDWQIKWAVENGVTAFLVDWYWIAGKQHLQQWFEAYRKARYRDMLPVAIMWANHNPPKTHSREDWRKVTQEWIDHYFTLPAYYTIDGKPAIYLWSPNNLRNDLGSSEEVRAALEESQRMAKAAGYPGIEFIVVNGHDSPAAAEKLLQEGYAGATNYHEWGRARDRAVNPKRYAFSDVAETAPARWREKNAWSEALRYYPVVDTGWDSRPWHGNKALAIEGRSTAHFETLLKEAKIFSQAHENRSIILGPANEWGEGSYVEPNTEFGFSMYEAIRKVFGQGDPATWPENIGPRDVALGPYDFLPSPVISAWDFEEEDHGWSAMMSAGDFRCENGALRLRSLGKDPAISVGLRDIPARDFPQIAIQMRLTGSETDAAGAQLFWSVNGQNPSEATSMPFPVHVDGEVHTYALNLEENPRWRGRITQLRFDPCDRPDLEIAIKKITLVAR